jgi:hypothetical protein
LYRTEQIPRPVDKMKRKAYYSGKKKKRHTTVKTQIMVNNHGSIIHKTAKKKGQRHMIIYSIYKKNHPITPKQVVNVADLRYLGIEKVFPQQLYALPNKKKRNQFLSDDEKEYNKIHSKERIVI